MPDSMPDLDLNARFFFSMPEDFHNARLMPVLDLNARFFSQCQEGFNNASFVKSGIENANLATLFFLHVYRFQILYFSLGKPLMPPSV